MFNRTNQIAMLIVILFSFLLFTGLSNRLLDSYRLDLTENGLFTLTDGTREILDNIDEPIHLRLFFSEKVSEDLTSLRAYAARVREMLEEYELRAGGKIRFSVIDPQPFSEEEDQAAEFGLQSVPVNQSGGDLYFGLVGTNALDDRETISFFQPDKEEFLEYELSKLIFTLSSHDKPQIALYSKLPVDEQIDPATFQQRPAWASIGQLKELFDVVVIDELTASQLAGKSMLILIHPKALDDDALFAVDQFVMGGGKLIAFVDPIAELDRPDPRMSGMGGMPGQTASDLNRLTSTWGVTLRTGEVLADGERALTVGGPSGAPVRHLGIVGFTDDNLSDEDVVTATLESMNFASAGIFDVDSVPGITASVLAESSSYSMPLPSMQFQFMSDPADLQSGFTPTGTRYPVVVRLSGKGVSAFPEGHGESVGALASTNELQVVLIADTDLLADRLWVQVQSFFGQQIYSAFADNGSFVTNLAENMSGNGALISVRSRGQFTRPFTVVESLRREAESSYLQSAEDLQARLSETESKLAELESGQADEGLLTLTPEQTAAITRFQDEKIRIRKELRDVRHQLDKDIEALGSRLKFFNIFLMPLLLTLAMLFGRFVLARRHSSVNKVGAGQ